MIGRLVRVAVIVGAAFVTACAAITAERSSSASDPSSPNAEEAPLPPEARLGPTGPERLAARDSGTEPPPPLTPAADAGAVGRFRCPMHPEVHRTGPGRCPQCGMTLVEETRATGGAR